MPSPSTPQTTLPPSPPAPAPPPPPPAPRRRIHPDDDARKRGTVPLFGAPLRDPLPGPQRAFQILDQLAVELLPGEPRARIIFGHRREERGGQAVIVRGPPARQRAVRSGDQALQQRQT